MNKTGSQTKAFTTVFLIEMWERFGYYGMAALLVLFMVNQLHFSDSKADLTWGAFTALVYTSPCIGGWIGDKILGTRRSMSIGAWILLSGYILLMIPNNSLDYMYGALAVIVVGNGLFKSNASNLVRFIYAGDDKQIDSAFTMYYMAVNIGSTISMLLTPWIRDHWGWHAAFAVCAVGMVLGIMNYLLMRKVLAQVGSEPDTRPINWSHFGYVIVGAIVLGICAVFILKHEMLAQICVALAGVALLGIFIYMLIKSSTTERYGLCAALVLIAQTILFFIFYQQMSTSLTLFALRNVSMQQYLFGFNIFNWSPAQFQSLNSIWIMLLSPILVTIYNWMSSRGFNSSIAIKFALGFCVVAAGFFVFGVSQFYSVNGLVSPWFMIIGYGLYSLGELLVSGLGLAMIARYIPARMGGLMMGAYYVATGISQYLGSYVANIAGVPANISAQQSLNIYAKLFTHLGWVAIGGVAIAVLLLPLMKKLSAGHQQLDSSSVA